MLRAYSRVQSIKLHIILESVNPEYEERLFIEFSKNTSSEHVVFKYCFECQNEKKQFLYTTCSELVLFGKFNKQSLVMLWVNWCNNGASDKDLPVWISIIKTMTILTSDRKVKMGNYLIMPLTLADDLFSNDTIQDCLYKLGMKTCVQI